MLPSNPLIELSQAHSGKYSDKWESYLHVYWEELQHIQNSSADILEIGIQNGGSLEIWAKFFPKVNKIFGYDNDPKCGSLKFDDPRIKVFVGDASSKDSAVTIQKFSSNLGLVIDDGSHKSSNIIRSFLLFFPQLNPGGIFIIEDLHASYWEDWEGGLSAPNSSMQFLKLLSDVVNYDNWGIEAKRVDIFESIPSAVDLLDEYVLSRVESVTFMNSLCIIKKRHNNDSGLGVRVGSGKVTEVQPIVKEEKGTLLVVPSQVANPFANPRELSLKRAIELKRENQSLKEDNQNLRNELHAMLRTVSWRITLPIRKIRQFFLDCSVKSK